jgi:hypothetical protein
MSARLPLITLLLASCSSHVSVSGDAFVFNGGSGLDGRLPGATVSLIERPELTATTAADGHFEIDGLDVDSEATMTLQLTNYHQIQTGTIKLGSDGATQVTFQVVHDAIYALLANNLGVVPDDTKCQIATTVGNVGSSLYNSGPGGEPGATVTLTPPAGDGPIYFTASTVPDRTLTETTTDGGVLFLQVPPGDYVMTASKAGATFSSVTVKCRAAWLVNASPPFGIQRLN